jgi:hypothetical protein
MRFATVNQKQFSRSSGDERAAAKGADMDERLVEIIDPTAARECERISLAPRNSPLHHKRIGLLDNSKPNADKFLGYVADLLRRRFDGIEIIFKRKMSRTEADCIRDLTERCDVVVTAFAD